MQEKYNEFLDSPVRKIDTVNVALYLRLSRDDGDKNESNSITMFKMDYEKKVFTMCAKPLKIETPNCVLVSEIEG